MNLEYRVAHVAEHLAQGPCGELGVRAEIRGDAVLLTGVVPSPECCENIREVATEELSGVTVRFDLVVAECDPPGRSEALP
ncbi:hypothetical protein [Streptomyces sp. NPDC000983]|uniref:hypothetical protein n=1 Tax=Streptomyces sp. NPDC000983 TaxID=3154373 RepID=UPI00332415CC